MSKKTTIKLSSEYPENHSIISIGKTIRIDSIKYNKCIDLFNELKYYYCLSNDDNQEKKWTEFVPFGAIGKTNIIDVDFTIPPSKFYNRIDMKFTYENPNIQIEKPEIEFIVIIEQIE